MKRKVIIILLVSVLLLTVFPVTVYSATGNTTLNIDSNSDNCRVQWNGDDWNLLTQHMTLGVGYYAEDCYNMGTGIRFNNVPIPQNATINKAHLIFTAFETTGNDYVVNSIIRGEKNAYPDEFQYYDSYRDRYLTSERVSWNNIDYWTKNEKYNSPDISEIIQEIVNMGDWKYGNSIALFWSDENGRSDDQPGAYRFAYSYSQSTTRAAKLYLSYQYQGDITLTPTPTVTPTPTATPTPTPTPTQPPIIVAPPVDTTPIIDGLKTLNTNMNKLVETQANITAQVKDMGTKISNMEKEKDYSPNFNEIKSQNVEVQAILKDQTAAINNLKGKFDAGIKTQQPTLLFGLIIILLIANVALLGYMLFTFKSNPKTKEVPKK